jgi:dCMP deaminase
MATKQELDTCYMTIAQAYAKLSKAKRKSVGAVIVTQNGVLLGGTNGLAPGGSNELEDEQDGALVTKPEVIHAELSAVLKAAREGVSVVGGTLYTTLSCCKPCSEMIAAAGITRVVYQEEYRDLSGIKNLWNHGITIEKYNGK